MYCCLRLGSCACAEPPEVHVCMSRAVQDPSRQTNPLLHCCLLLWADFDWTQVPANSNELQLPGNTHAGFNKVALYLWTVGIQAAIDAEVLRGRITNVAFAGHSLGASVAGLLAYATQVRK